MSVFWLIPFEPEHPEQWCEGSFSLSVHEADELVHLAKEIHPRWLMMIKWNSLFADGPDQCGGSDDDVDAVLLEKLSKGTPVSWDSSESSNFALSHCAQAFFDARLSMERISSIEIPVEWTRHHLVQTILEWRSRGMDVFLLKGMHA